MGKKKSGKKKQQQQKPLSPERFMREKARTLPIADCYVNNDWKEAGKANVWVTRRRTDGDLVVASFLIDTYCLGVKDAFFFHRLSVEKLSEYLDYWGENSEVEQISYDEAHNIIYGAIAFAEEGGIEPAKDFYPAAYILEEDTDDVPLIEYTFGKDGNHFLLIGEERDEARYLSILQKKLGEAFDFAYLGDSGDDELDEGDEEYDPALIFTPENIKRVVANMNNCNAESSRHPDEVYSYQYPEYPSTLSVKNQFIADALLSPLHYKSLPREVIGRILALPRDEAAGDIAAIIMYVIGITYKGINEGLIEHVDHSAIMHSIILLTAIHSERGLPAVLEIMRQSDDFAEVHLGDLCTEITHYAIYSCGLNNVQAIEDYIKTPGMNTYFRVQAVSALAMIVANHPERRAEIIEVFRRKLADMVTRLPQQEASDGTFAGLMMGDLMDLHTTELIPEIKAVFDTGCVDKTISGNCATVLRHINAGIGIMDMDRYTLPDIYEQYLELERAIS